MEKETANYAPFKIEMKIMLIGEGGEYDGYTAWADIDLPAGRLPTKEAIDDNLNEAAKQQGFRLATRHEFIAAVLEERTGVSGFAIPNLGDFAFVPAIGQPSRSNSA
jgi:hypothetical protein